LSALAGADVTAGFVARRSAESAGHVPGSERAFTEALSEPGLLEDLELIS
jgi:hypothetical protein